MFKNKPVPLSSLGNSEFKNHFLVVGKDDLKQLSLLKKFVVETGQKVGHSVTICSPLEAEYLKKKLSRNVDQHDYLHVDISSMIDRVASDEALVLPVTTFKLMISALKARTASSGGDDVVWYARAIGCFTAMIPYLESMFFECKAVPGVDISDTAMTEKVERRVPMSVVKSAMRLKSIKSWLLLQKESPQRESLFSYVKEVPGFQNLTESREEELRHHAYAVMCGSELLNTVAPIAEGNWVEKMKTMMTVGRGHIVISVPTEEIVDRSLSREYELMKTFLSVELRSVLGKHLPESDENHLISVIDTPEKRSLAPFYASASFLESNLASPMLSQIRSMGYMLCLHIGQDSSKLKAVQNFVSEAAVPKLILDREALLDFTVPLSKKVMKEFRTLPNSASLFCGLDKGLHLRMSMFD